MGFLEVILSSPLPTVLALFVAGILLAGYWFIVLPQLAEMKNLRENHTEALSTIAKFDENFIKINDNTTKTNVSLQAVTAIVERQAKQMQVLTQHTLHISQRTKNIEEQVAALQVLARNSEHALRILSEISDKQSQLSGVVFGLNLRGTNPPRGP